MKLLAAFILLVAAGVAQAQTVPTTVASCPTAASGTTWATGAWLPCPAVSYVPVPLPPAAIVSSMRCSPSPCVFKWVNQPTLLPTDSVWVKNQAFPAGTWVLAKTVTFSAYTAPASVSWAVPPTNVDGSAITPGEITGYNIYAGISAAALSKLATVGPTVFTYSMTMGVGTVFFAVTAVTSSGESAQSNVVSKTLAAPSIALPSPPVLSP